ncbi:hypothetical protein [Kordia sp.]|uniref:hypothetical protein n=1 Tax=Kordia sp. TaxID=1965332 RepID=UPI003D2E4FA6
MEEDIQISFLNKLSCFFLIVLFLGCDTPGKILIKNETQDDVIYRYYKKETDENVAIDTVSIHVPALSEKYIILGFGSLWTESQLKSYIQNLQKIELIKATDTIVLKDKVEIYNYFKKRIKGVHKDEIEIIIK